MVFLVNYLEEANCVLVGGGVMLQVIDSSVYKVINMFHLFTVQLLFKC